MTTTAEDSEPAEPPASLRNYSIWCAENGRRAWGTPGDAATHVEAYCSLQQWLRERRVFLIKHPEAAQMLGYRRWR